MLRQVKPARNLKRTLLDYEEEVTELYNRGINFKEAIKIIHTSTVQSSVNSYTPNRVLQRLLPVINPEEQDLDRNTRST